MYHERKPSPALNIVPACYDIIENLIKVRVGGAEKKMMCTNTKVRLQRRGGGEGEMQRKRDERGSQKKMKKYGKKTGTR